MKLENRVAIITGSSMGIGEATAAAFLKEGAKVVINSRDQRRAEAAADKLKRQGCDQVLPLAGDVADREACFNLVRRTLDKWGRVDILVNNAGVAAISNSEDLGQEQWQRTMDVNLSGCFYCSQAVAKLAMIPQKRGNIIMLSSILGNVGLHRRVAYCTTKHGLIGMTKVLGVEWAKYNIRVNALCPGYIWTPMETGGAETGINDYTEQDIKRRTPMGRYGTAEEQAAACVWLASDDSSYTTGSVLLSDGGWVAYGGW
jgi:NAD(P)-dependent dehydrogenase (short-subunit alcohol dehydrogenase family)